jgi:hypothetical protein
VKIYWWGDIPEIAALSPSQQGEAWRACYFQHGLKYWETWVSLVLTGFLAALGGGIADWIGAAIGGGLGGLVFGQVLTNKLRPHLRDYVARTPTRLERVERSDR